MASGREVTATKAKSFLKRVDNEIIQVNGEDIVVGDRLPVSRVLSIDTNLLELDLSKYLPKKEWLYMSEVHKSYEFATEMGWWEAHNGQDFTLPYSEFPSFSTMLDSVKCHNYGNDCVYPRTAVDADTKRILDEDIVYDEVVSIEEVNNMHPYVYDLTVEGTRNFNTYTGICMADTFHSAGISSASKAVRGVPRLQELLNVTKKIKTPIMTIHVKPHFRTESSTKEEYKTKCLNILHELSTTRFKNIVSKAQIHYDPNDFDSKIEEDKRFIDMYRMFNDVTEQNVKVSPWLLRFEFDRQNMINIGINMIDLQNVLHGFYDDKVSCMFSDDNSSNLVMRVKLTTDSVESGEDMLAEIKALQHNIMENGLKTNEESKDLDVSFI
eukprot:gene12123-15229_t